MVPPPEPPPGPPEPLPELHKLLPEPPPGLTEPLPGPPEPPPRTTSRKIFLTPDSTQVAPTTTQKPT